MRSLAAALVFLIGCTAASTSKRTASGALDAVESDAGVTDKEVSVSEACLTGVLCAIDSDCDKAQRCNSQLTPPACQILYCSDVDQSCDATTEHVLCRDGLYCIDAVRDFCSECVQQCESKECGGDGCGGICGTCATGICLDGQCCSPQCEGKECGGDGCGGSCGDCTTPASCNAGGLCVCEPQCVDKQCGDDGCGGSCGDCTTSASCNADGLCVCEPDCVDNPCGDDGCGGRCGCFCQSGDSFCNGDMLFTCAADGSKYDTTVCEQGCVNGVCKG